MKKIIISIIFIAIISVFCFADPVEGYWLSIDDKTGKVTAGWHIYQENGVLFGKILSLADEPRGTIADACNESYRGFPVAGRVNTMQVAGTPWIFGLSRRAEGDWRGGNIIDPEDGRMYGCVITFRASGTSAGRQRFTEDTLEMRGTIGPFGRSQYWRRTDFNTANSLWPN